MPIRNPGARGGRWRLAFLASLGALAAGCAEERAARSGDFLGAGVHAAREVQAPEKTRCERADPPLPSCPEALGAAQQYVRRLATGDMVCLEGGMGEEAGPGCVTRAAVIDTDIGQVLLEIRRSRPGSKWFSREIERYWFAEGALVDLYLSEQGY